jgi:hypothetical protein
MKNRSNPIMESYLKNPVRHIMVYTEQLSVYKDGKVFADDDKLVLELEFDPRSMSDEELQDELETLLYYDYQDNKE